MENSFITESGKIKEIPLKSNADFNTKYGAFLAPKHYGLEIDNIKVIEYLDKLFAELVHIPGFKYYQIKTKFGSVRFYTNLYDLRFVRISRMLETKIEEDLNKIIKE